MADPIAFDPDKVATVEQLASRLRAAHVKDGAATRRVLEERVKRLAGEHKLYRPHLPAMSAGRTTIGRVLEGKSFPKIELLFTLLDALGVDAGQDPAWELAWGRVKSGLTETGGTDSAAVPVRSGSNQGRPDLAGKLLTGPAGDRLFVVNPEGYLQEIPDEQTRHNLFEVHDSNFTRDPNVEKYPRIDSLPQGEALTAGACLIRAEGRMPVYIFSNQVKRWIVNPGALHKYHFNAGAIADVPGLVIDCLPSGDDWS